MFGKGGALYSILKLKCPRCQEGDVLESGVYNLKKLGHTNTTCSNCGLKYSREPGFFYGAAYVSYALTVAFGTATAVIFALLRPFLFPELNFIWLIPVIIAVLIFLFPLAFALARVIWLNLFVKYNPIARGER